MRHLVSDKRKALENPELLLLGCLFKSDEANRAIVLKHFCAEKNVCAEVYTALAEVLKYTVPESNTIRSCGCPRCDIPVNSWLVSTGDDADCVTLDDCAFDAFWQEA